MPSILLVEDNSVDARYFKEVIGEYEVTVAETLEEGLELFSTGDYDHIGFDMRLPDAGPADVLTAVRQLEEEGYSVFVYTGQPHLLEGTTHTVIRKGAPIEARVLRLTMATRKLSSEAVARMRGALHGPLTTI